MLLALELGVAALALIVFLLGLGGRERGSREVGLVTAGGHAGLFGLSLVLDARGPFFDGSRSSCWRRSSPSSADSPGGTASSAAAGSSTTCSC